MEIKNHIKKYDKFENLNLLKVNSNNKTGIITGIFSAHQTSLLKGLIEQTIKSIKLKRCEVNKR